MCYLNNGPKIQKDQSLRQSVSCEYHMNEDKSNRIKKKKKKDAGGGENLRALTTTTINLYI